MTVSKALRDAKDVSAATRARIKAIAQQLGYVPDSRAPGLRTRTTRLFGVLVSALSSPIFSRVVLALEERAQDMGYEILVAQTLDEPAREEACLRRFLARRVDGLFIVPAYRLTHDGRLYQELLARQVPTVLMGHLTPFCAGFVNVESDDLLGSYFATRHLMKLGHKRIAFLSGPAGTPWSAERLEGYRRALREDGIEMDDKLVFQAGRSIEDGAKATLQVINESSDATAIQTVNDMVAIGCAETLLQQGLRVPQDLSVVGFGNILMAQHFRVPLTTCRQAKYRLGAAAMESMQQLLKGIRPETKRLPAELIVRESSGTAPASSRIRPLTKTNTNAKL
jgi:LacI family transcriptional regulator